MATHKRHALAEGIVGDDCGGNRHWVVAWTVCGRKLDSAETNIEKRARTRKPLWRDVTCRECLKWKKGSSRKPSKRRR